MTWTSQDRRPGLSPAREPWPLGWESCQGHHMGFCCQEAEARLPERAAERSGLALSWQPSGAFPVLERWLPGLGTV